MAVCVFYFNCLLGPLGCVHEYTYTWIIYIQFHVFAHTRAPWLGFQIRAYSWGRDSGEPTQSSMLLPASSARGILGFAVN